MPFMWIIPTRSRPHRLAALIDACEKTGMSTPALIMLDDDDPMLGSYWELDRPQGWVFVSGPRRYLSARYNNAFAALPGLDWYGFLADDVVPETPGWDRTLIDAAGSDCLAFGDDGINGGNHATHFVLGGDLVRETGWLCLPGLQRIYIDTVWTDLAQDKGVHRYLSHVKLTHHHFSNGKALMDSTYRKPGKEADRRVYDAWKVR